VLVVVAFLVSFSGLSRVVSIVIFIIVSMNVLVASKVYILVRVVHLSEATVMLLSHLLTVSVPHGFPIVGVVKLMQSHMLVALIIMIKEGSVLYRLVLQVQISLAVAEAGKSRD